MPAAASCTPSAEPVFAALRSRPTSPVTSSPPSLNNSRSLGRRLKIRPRGVTSKDPIAAPRREAVPRSSSVAPAARARSLASPAPAPIPNVAAPPMPIAPAAGAEIGAAAARSAGLAIPAIEPRPDASLYAMESGSPRSGRIASATDWIF
jgi:hypothetical protein